MRKGFLSSIAALTASAGLAWGQANMPSVASFPGGPALPDPIPIGGPVQLTAGGQPTIIGPPQISGGAIPVGSDPIPFPSNGPQYPPPGNFGNFDLTGQGPPPQQGYGEPEAPRLPHFYANGEYLMMFMTAAPINTPLITTSSPVAQGILGRPTTSVLFGADEEGFGVVSGFRVTTGAWFDSNARVGLELSGFVMEQQASIFDAVSSARGVPTFARPYVDSTTGQQVSFLAAFPELAAGTINALSETQVWGSEGNVLMNMYRSRPTSYSGWTINSLLGFRYVQVEEQLAIASGSHVLPGNSIPFAGLFLVGPAVVGVSDSFLARNEFYGGNFGLQTQFRSGRFLFGMNSKLGVGNMHSRLDVNGSSTLTTGRAIADGTTQFNATSVQGGLFANSGNIGRYIRDEFVVIPELNLSLGCQLTSYLSTNIGYNLLYIPDIVRPGQQFGPAVNSSLVPTSFAYGQSGFNPVARPTLETSEFYLHGLSFSMTFQY